MSIYDSFYTLREELDLFHGMRISLGVSDAHRIQQELVTKQKNKWTSFCAEYKERTGETFLHSPVNLRRLRLLFDLHDEDDLDYRGIRRAPPGFDWTYALPYYTHCIRLTGATGVEHSLLQGGS